MVYIKQRHKEP